jgi:hypothetical protein
MQGSVSMGAKEVESSTGCIWAAGFHHLIAHSQLMCSLKPTNHLLLSFKNFCGGHGKPQITETTDTESAGTGAQLYCHLVKCIIQTNYRDHLKKMEMRRKQWKYL